MDSASREGALRAAVASPASPRWPKVIVNMAPSLDGKIAPAHARGPFVMSRHEEDPARMRRLRASADAVMIGAGNLRLDDPDLSPARLRVVVTRSGEGVGPSHKAFARSAGGEAIIAHASSMPESRRALLRPHATLVELGQVDVPPRALLEWLARERSVRTVVCEGGAVLNASLLAAGAIDELHLTLVPRILGGVGAPSLFGASWIEPDAAADLRLVRCDRVGDELFVVYAFETGHPMP